MKKLIKLSIVVGMTIAALGCSGTESTEDAKVNSDIGKGAPPAGLSDGAATGGASQPAAPSSSP